MKLDIYELIIFFKLYLPRPTKCFNENLFHQDYGSSQEPHQTEKFLKLNSSRDRVNIN